MTKKHKTAGGKTPPEFPSRRGKNNNPEIDEVVVFAAKPLTPTVKAELKLTTSPK